MSQNLSSTRDLNGDQEISLLEILCFLKNTWKTILVTGALGLAGAGVYLLISPNQYEAIGSIAMGRISPVGTNIEEPVALINRMSVPGSFDAAVLEVCGLRESRNAPAQSTKAIKLAIPKGVANIVELKVTRSSPELARVCADAVYQGIAKSQAQMIDPIAQAVKVSNSARLAKVEELLAQDKALLAKAEQPKGAVSPTYFAILSEIRSLDDEREKLVTTVNASSVQATNLQSPIYVADQPISPKKSLTLFAGLMGGLLLGLLLALGSQMVIKLKSGEREVL
jgi:LPS O-antigen subunit length determinant protein (WzzB/FepE family)